jgi:RNA polymerase sigma factor (sigma-70 family)
MTDLAVRREPLSEPVVADFQAFYRSEFTRFVRLAHLITGSNIAAEDVVHDVFTAALGRWGQIADPYGYVYKAVVNRSRSALRRRRLELRHLGEPEQVVLPADVDEVWEALATVPLRRRTALVLRYYEDLPTARIAELMNTRPSTVRSLIHRGTESLRKALEP